MRRRWSCLALAAAAAGWLASAPAAHAASHLPRWTLYNFVADFSSLHHVDAVSRRVAWFGSDEGRVYRTIDGGRTFDNVSPPATAGLHFRNVTARDADHAVAMAAGGGAPSQIYVTSDGGTTWRRAFLATNPDTFLDGLAFSDDQHGLAVGDPTDGRSFEVFSTEDGGETWHQVATTMPPALPDEFGIVDSGSSLSVLGREAWFGTAAGAARIYHSADRGRSWDVSNTPIAVDDPAGTAGIYGVAMRTPDLGVAVGGSFLTPAQDANVSAVLTNGRPWRSPTRETRGFRSSASWLPTSRPTAVAVGITGSDISYDGGRHWTRFDYQSLISVDCAEDGSCWGAGLYGTVTVMQAVSGPGIRRLVHGLRGTLGSTVGPDGALYLPNGVDGTIERVDPRTGRHAVWARGLPRRLGALGGAVDVAFLGRTAYVLVTLVGTDVGGHDVVGVYRLDRHRRAQVLADIGAWSLAHPPVPPFFVPTGVQYAMQADLGSLLVTDAHHNRVLRVAADGSIAQLRAFDNVVPTGLAKRGGRVVLAEAGAVPHLANTGRLLELNRRSGVTHVIATGARLCVDAEFGPHGTLYALSQGVFDPGHDEGTPADPSTGALLRAQRDGTMTPIAVGLDRPTSMEIIGDHAYVVTLAGDVVVVRLS